MKDVRCGDSVRRAGLVGQVFLSTAVHEHGALRELVPETRIRVEFTSDSRILVDAGCNTIDGRVIRAGERLEINDLRMTERACPDRRLHQQDDWLVEFFATGPFYDYRDARLLLRAEDVEIMLAPREIIQPDLPLTGTRWQLTHIVNDLPPGAPIDPTATVSARPVDGVLTFDGDHVQGRVGAVAITGPVQVDDGVLQVGYIRIDGCPEKTEETVLGVLEGEVGYQITATHLTLTHLSGAGVHLRAQQNTT